MINKNDYKNVYVFAEQRGGVIQPVALELIGKARDLAEALGEKVVAILAGYNVEGLIPTLFEYGADEVVVTDHIELKDYLTEQYAQSVYQIITAMRPNIVLFGATTIGRDLAPRLSARLSTGLTADCTKLEISEDKQLMMTRPAFGGNLMATIMCTEHRPQMSTVRPGVMPKRDPSPAVQAQSSVSRPSLTTPRSGSASSRRCVRRRTRWISPRPRSSSPAAAE